MVLLVGAGIALASSTLTDRGGGNGKRPEPTKPPPPALSLTAPDPALTREQTVNVAGVLPADLDRTLADELRVYINGDLQRERSVPDEPNFTISGLPLDEGENEISASLAGDGGESPLSEPVTVTRDSTPPDIIVSRPEPGSTVYEPTEIVRGRTEPGATVEVADENGGRPLTTTVSPDGRFESSVELAMGSNAFVIRSVDPAGNRASTRLEIQRDNSLASVSLTVFDHGLPIDEIDVADLPQSVDLVADVQDELGRESDGATVTFSLSPPNRTTTTYAATTSGGKARWPNLLVDGGSSATGTWLVTVLATTPSGQTLRGDASISVR
jgi:hypothetical protein